MKTIRYISFEIIILTALCLLFATQAAAIDSDFPSSYEALVNWQKGDSKQLIELPAYRIEQRMQNSISECMAAAGFQYKPYIPDSMFPSLSDQLTEDKGIVASYIESTVNPMGNAKHSDNPNEKILQSLSDDERDNYIKQLWDKQNGCATQAFRETHAAAVEIIGKDRADAYEKALNDISVNLSEDPLVKNALDSWSTCATQATGVDLDDPTDIEKLVLDELNRSFIAFEGESLEATMHSAVDTTGPLKGGSFSEAIESARVIERTLVDATQPCDQALSSTMEQVRNRLAWETLQRYEDVVQVLMGE
jgi:hypothetical protein